MSDNVTGSCLCRSVKYVITNPFKAVANCHCNTCKKITGGVFGTIAVIGEQDLEITSGKETLTTYQVSEHALKHFCRICGTPIFNLHKKYPDKYMVQVGSLDDPALAEPAINIFCESMLPWVKGIAGLQSFEREPLK